MWAPVVAGWPLNRTEMQPEAEGGGRREGLEFNSIAGQMATTMHRHLQGANTRPRACQDSAVKRGHRSTSRPSRVTLPRKRPQF